MMRGRKRRTQNTMQIHTKTHAQQQQQWHRQQRAGKIQHPVIDHESDKNALNIYILFHVM